MSAEDAEVELSIENDQQDVAPPVVNSTPSPSNNRPSPSQASPSFNETRQFSKNREVDPEKNYDMGSYLNPGQSFKMTAGVKDAAKWGKSATLDPEKQNFDYGSYLKGDTPQHYAGARVSDANKFGSNKEIFDEQKLVQGSYLQSQLAHQQEQFAKQEAQKRETIEQLKKDAGLTYLDPEEHVFPYEQLKNKFPKGVDPTKKEYYLPDEEFTKLFGCSIDQYEAWPPFKKRSQKQKLGLF